MRVAIGSDHADAFASQPEVARRADRAPAGRRGRLGLRRSFMGELRSPVLPSREAAFDGECGRQRGGGAIA